MHPSKFFDECIIDEITLDIFEREEMKNKLKSIHPRNIIGSSVRLFVVKVRLEYTTGHNNRKESEKYTLLPLDIDSNDSLELQAEIMCQSNIETENMKYINTQMNDYKIINVEIVTQVVLPIG